MKYRELGLKDKLETMSEEEQIRLLATDGMLVKRPLIIGEKILTGFREKNGRRSCCSLKHGGHGAGSILNQSAALLTGASCAE